ncbi:hypothetical protein MNBD_GAMMA08-3049 [hydrothermal vent metagenome]|uniref:Cupin type-2 domain-containing protein n=1 Tax=hydrothermal vent metagenome TaxID=652676 RepID=A0A3B0XH74_9ZZZZ
MYIRKTIKLIPNNTFSNRLLSGKLKMQINNVFSNIPENINQEIIEVLLQSKNIKIEKIISKGQCSPATGWYDQAQNEWVIVLKGEAKLVFEKGEDVDLVAGSYINIQAHKKHRVSWTHPDIETVWLAVFY